MTSSTPYVYDGESERVVRDSPVDVDRSKERWVADCLARRSTELGRRLRVLDFGCGSESLARLLAAMVQVDYFGYGTPEHALGSLSGESVPVAAEIGVAKDVAEAFPEIQFDVAVTASIMVRNAPEQARRLLSSIERSLAPDGRVILLENPLSALSFREPSGEPKLWVHDVAGELARDWSIDVHAYLPSNCAAYHLSRADAAGRVLRLADHSAELRDVTLDDLRLAGLERVAERLSADREGDARRGPPVSLGGGAGGRERVLEPSLSLRSELRRAIAAARSDILEPRPGKAPGRILHAGVQETRGFVHDAPLDHRFANKDARFGNVAQVFHQEWFGIRAAAGALPGAKLGISANRALSAGEMESIVADLRARGIAKLVVHGMSENMYAFAVGMKRAGFEMFGVWHGTAAMWCWEPERKFFQLMAKLLANGVLRRFNAIRRGMEVAAPGENFAKQLLNPVPSCSVRRHGARRSQAAIAFSPSWNLLHKNLGTNLAAAGASERVGEIWVMAEDAVHVAACDKPLRRLPPQDQMKIIQTMSAADIVLNVSVVDCHPMVDLEALAARTPCLRGPLFLDVLEDHPYVRLTEVANPLSIADIRSRLDEVLASPQAEVDAMMEDYAGALSRLAVDRYAEFLEL